jgi:putative tricarboxylic transport membrane protein
MSTCNAEEASRMVTHPHRINQVIALLWIVLGVVFVTQSWSLEYWSAYGPGPGFLPVWLGVGFVLVGLIVLGQFTRGRKEKDVISLPSKLAARQMILVTVGFCGFVFLAESVGFITCIGLLFFFILTVVEKKRWKFSLAVALISALAYWTVFEWGCELRLPPGLLELLR